MSEEAGGNQPHKELELKFEFDPAFARRLSKAAWLRAIQSGRASTRALTATYFDTPEKDLHQSGLSLRVRKEGRVYKQTLKAQDTAAFVRREWETRVRQPVPNRDEVFSNPDFRRHINGRKVETLEPVFETRIRRTTRNLIADGETQIECDLDVGEIAAGEKSKAISELELELKSGDPRRLFDIARRIAEIVPLRLVHASKSEQGYALLNGGRAEWIKQPKVKLPGGATGEDVLVRSVAACLDHLSANVDCVLQRAHIEGVHQARIALRRLRAALTLYKPLLPKDRRKQVGDQVKAIASSLGPARDWDVFGAEVLAPVEKAMPGDKYLKLLRDEVEHQCDMAYALASGSLTSPEYTRMQIDVADFIHACDWRQSTDKDVLAYLFSDATKLASHALDKAHNKLLKRGKKIDKMSKRARHDLRIDVKKVRYAAEFFAPLYGKKPVAAYLANLKQLQDALGVQNDLEVARHLVNSLGKGLDGEQARQVRYAGGVVVGWHAHAAAEREGSLMTGWKAFSKSDPFWK